RCPRGASRSPRCLADVPGLSDVETANPLRPDPHNHALDLRIAVRTALVALGQSVDVFVGAVEGRVYQPTFDERLPEHVLRIHQLQRDAAITAQVLEPGAFRSAVEPDQPILRAVLEPQRMHEHAAIAPGSPDHDRNRLVEERLQTRAKLDGHAPSLPSARLAGTADPPAPM